jgi:hypothetical protein
MGASISVRGIVELFYSAPEIFIFTGHLSALARGPDEIRNHTGLCPVKPEPEDDVVYGFSFRIGSKRSFPERFLGSEYQGL